MTGIVTWGLLASQLTATELPPFFQIMSVAVAVILGSRVFRT